uniref:5-formyltetrahydrofolate cyclo-ligase n=1 Tax=Syphacia muris TaxID=451379 RepID=A0A0N5AGD5_9BILA
MISVDTIQNGKKELRRIMAKRSSLVQGFDVALQSRSIFEQVKKSKWYMDSKRISVYVSTNAEVSTDALIRESILNDKQVFIPNFQRESNLMDMFRLESIEDFCNLTTTLWGIRQHSNVKKELSWKNYGAFDLIIVPGVAFTNDGLRLGHGKGYYDKFLNEHLKSYGHIPYTVGLALQHQIVADLPHSSSDVPLSLVLTSV